MKNEFILPDESMRSKEKTLPQLLLAFLASSKLAMALLVGILVFCVIGVTVMRATSGELIFGSLWFNGILVLLVVNVACCFFGRIWGRKVTVISFGMILFHLSFVAMFVGIIYNSLFFFDGTIMLTEGESLRSADPKNYDNVRHGRFFDYSWLKGETTLTQVHPRYTVDEKNKGYAYDILLGEGSRVKKAVIYLTEYTHFNGFRYFNQKEGFSTLVVMYDKDGNEVYGAHVPLQSLKQPDQSYLYTTGTKDAAGTVQFPQNTMKPIYDLQVAYRPDKEEKRAGEVFFSTSTRTAFGIASEGSRNNSTGTAQVGEKFFNGTHYFSPKEIRYWVGMNVRFDPGQPVVMVSLWVGLAGMVITTAGRIMRGRRKSESKESVGEPDLAAL